MTRLSLIILFMGLTACEERPNPITTACSSDANCANGLQCMALSGCDQDTDGNGVADVIDACEAGGGYACAADFGALAECQDQEGMRFCDRDMNGNGHPDFIDLGMVPDTSCTPCEATAQPNHCNPYCFEIEGEVTYASPSEDTRAAQANDEGTTSDTNADTSTTPAATDAAGCVILETAPNLAWDDVNEFYTIDVGNIGAAGLDYVRFEFYTAAGETGTYDLDSGDNSNYETCSTCILAVQDDGEAGETFFYQESGELVVSPNSMTNGGPVTLTLQSVTLREVTFGGADGLTSSPVAGGECLSFPSPLTLATL